MGYEKPQKNNSKVVEPTVSNEKPTTDVTQEVTPEVVTEKLIEGADANTGATIEPANGEIGVTTQSEEIKDPEAINPEAKVEPETVDPKTDTTKVDNEIKETDPAITPDDTDAPEVPVGGNLTVDDVKKILASPDKTFVEKLTQFSKFAPVAIKMLAIKLLSYEKDMANITEENATKGANKNFDLFNAIMQVIKEEDYNLFKLQFDIINLTFITFKNSSYDEESLHRFDYKWSAGDKKLKSYTNLVTLISLLADAGTRKVNINKVSLPKVFNQTDTVFTLADISNVTKYYEV